MVSARALLLAATCCCAYLRLAHAEESSLETRSLDFPLRQTGPISGEIQRGIQSWDVDLKSCNLNLHLQEFLSQHTASFKGAGQKCLRHSSRELDTQVLIGPSQEQAQAEVVEASQRSGSTKSRTGIQSGVTKGNVLSARTPASSTRSPPAKSSPNPGVKSASGGEVSVYVDLAYIPSGPSCPTVGVDFFRCVRSTFESVPMQEWYQQTLDRQKELGITVLGSNSTVAMQDETFPACKIEF